MGGTVWGSWVCVGGAGGSLWEGELCGGSCVSGRGDWGVGGAVWGKLWGENFVCGELCGGAVWMELCGMGCVGGSVYTGVY